MQLRHPFLWFCLFLFLVISLVFLFLVALEIIEKPTTVVNITNNSVLPVPVEVNGKEKKDIYSEKEVFLISDEDWRDVLQLVPVAVWTDEDGEIHSYPTLIYHQEGEAFDADSIIYFLQQYEPDTVTIIGQIPSELEELLITDPELGAGLEENQLQRISAKDYLSYWQEYKDIVYVEDDYGLALMASTYASLINAPLIIQGGDLNVDENFNNKNIICVGSVERSCNEQYNLEQLQQKYIQETDTDKIILVNSKDFDIKMSEEFQPEKSENPIYEIYSRTSLAAPILASAKHEVIFDTSNESIDEDAVDTFVKDMVEKLFVGREPPQYLTIIASPNAIIDSVFVEPDDPFEVRDNRDVYYAIDPNTINSRNDYLGGIAVDTNQNIHVLFTSIIGATKFQDGDKNLYYKVLDSQGNILINNHLISDDNTASKSSILIDSRNNVLAFWTIEDSNYRKQLYYSKLDSKGNILINNKKLDISRYSFISISIDSNDNILIAAAHDDSLYFYKLDEEGNILNSKQLSTNHVYDLSSNIDSADNYHITYRDNKKRHYIKLDKDGNILINDIELFTETTSPFVEPSTILFDTSNNAYVFSIQVKEQERNIYLSKIDNNGNVVIDSKRINIDTDCGYCISGLSGTGIDNFNLVWSDFRDKNWEIYYSKIDEHGNILISDQRLTNQRMRSDNPMIISHNNKLVVFFNDDREGLLNIYYKTYTDRWGDVVKFSSEQNISFNFRMKVGRIYSLTVSDVSSYIARSIFYNDLFNKTYGPNEFTGLSIGHHWAYSDYNDVAQYIKIQTENSGYNSECFTGEYREGCSVDMKPDISNYNKKQFITFSDHGSPSGWGNTLLYNEIPWLDLPYVMGEACLTNDFWRGGKKTFGAWMLRKGAIGYHGAVGTSTGNLGSAINSIYLLTGAERISLGDIGNADLMFLDRNYRSEVILLGDPTLIPKFKEVHWQ